MNTRASSDSVPREEVEGVPSALKTLEPVIRQLLSSLRGAVAANQALLLLADPAHDDQMRLLVEAAAGRGQNGVLEPGMLPSTAALERDFPGEGPVGVDLPTGYAALWKGMGRRAPRRVLWIPLNVGERRMGGILLAGGGAEEISSTGRVAVGSAAENLQSLLGQVLRLEQENVMFSQLITMLRNTRTLMRESEAGHLVNMTLSTLSRIVGNNRLALFPTTVLGSQRAYVRQVEIEEATELHRRLMEHLDPRQGERAQGRQARVDTEALCGSKMNSFSSATPWVLRDAGHTYLGMLYLFDNDPAQEDTLTHSVIRTIVVELERTLRRYLIEDDAAHAVIELPYRIWSREYWLRRFEEEIALTGRRGTRVACGILEILDYHRLTVEMDPMMLQESVLAFLQVVKASVRETDLITRLGRNHFGVLFLDAAKSRVMPAIERMGTRLTRVVGGAAMAPRIGFVAGLAEFPWDGEGVPSIMRRAWTAAIMAREHGPFTVESYQHDQAEQFLSDRDDLRMEIEVHLELLGRLELPEVTGSSFSSEPSER